MDNTQSSPELPQRSSPLATSFSTPVIVLCILGLVVVSGGVGYYLGASSRSQVPQMVDDQPQMLETSELTQYPEQEDLSDPVEVTQKYLRAYVQKDWDTVRSMIADTTFDEATVASHQYTDFEISGSTPDSDPDLYRVRIQLVDQNGKMISSSSGSGQPLEVLLRKNAQGQWQPLTWYFTQ